MLNISLLFSIQNRYSSQIKFAGAKKQGDNQPVQSIDAILTEMGLQGSSADEFTKLDEVEYRTPTRFREFVDSFVGIGRIFAELVRLKPEDAKKYKKLVKDIKNVKNLVQARTYTQDLLNLINDHIEVIQSLDAFQQRRLSASLFRLLKKVEEKDQPFYFVNKILSRPDLLPSQAFFLRGLQDHELIALKPSGIFAPLNNLITTTDPKNTLKARGRLALTLMEYIRRQSHNLSSSTRVANLIRTTFKKGSQALSIEEALVLKEVLGRVPAGESFRQTFAEMILEPISGEVSIETSAVKRNPAIGIMTEQDQKRFLKYLTGDMELYKTNLKAAIKVLQKTLEPRKGSVEKGPILRNLEERLKSYFFGDDLIPALAESSAGTQLMGIQGVFENISIPSSIAEAIRKKLVNSLVPADKHRLYYIPTRNYRLPLAQLIMGVVKGTPEEEELRQIMATYGIADDFERYDLRNADAIIRRLDETVVGMQDVKLSLAYQWKDYQTALSKGLHATHPIILIDGANGTGKTSTLRRFAMEIHTDRLRQIAVSSGDFWTGATKNYDSDFCICTANISTGLDDWDEEDIEEGVIEDYLVEVVTELRDQLTHNAATPKVILFDELSKVVSRNVDARDVQQRVFDAVADLIYSLATTGKYQVPGRNILVSLPKDAIIGITANFATPGIIPGKSFDPEALKSQEIFSKSYWQGEHARKLQLLLQDKTFIRGLFNSDSVDELVEHAITQQLPYIAALKSARIRFDETEKTKLKRFYHNFLKRNAPGAVHISGREIATQLKTNLFEPVALKSINPGSTIIVTFNIAKSENSPVFDFNLMDPVQTLEDIPL